jgi:hypothetical protein
MKLTKSHLRELIQVSITQTLNERNVPCYTPEQCFGKDEVARLRQLAQQNPAAKSGDEAEAREQLASFVIDYDALNQAPTAGFPPKDDAEAQRLAEKIAANYVADLPNNEREAALVYLGIVSALDSNLEVLGNPEQLRSYVDRAKKITQDPRGRTSNLKKALAKWAHAKIKAHAGSVQDGDTQFATGGKSADLMAIYDFFQKSTAKSPEARAYRTQQVQILQGEGDKVIAAVKPGPNRQSRLSAQAKERASGRPAKLPAADADKKRKAKQKMAKASRQRNRPGNRSDNIVEEVFQRLVGSGAFRLAEGQEMGDLAAAARSLIKDAEAHLWNTGYKPTDPWKRIYVEKSDASDEVKQEALRIIGWQ